MHLSHTLTAPATQLGTQKYSRGGGGVFCRLVSVKIITNLSPPSPPAQLLTTPFDKEVFTEGPLCVAIHIEGPLLVLLSI